MHHRVARWFPQDHRHQELFSLWPTWASSQDDLLSLAPVRGDA